MRTCLPPQRRGSASDGDQRSVLTASQNQGTPAAVGVIEVDGRARALDTLMLAFAADPVMRWFWPDPHRYAAYWHRFVEAFGGSAFDHRTAYWLEGGAVALWLPPGAHPDDDALGALMIESLDGEILADVGAVAEQMGEFHPAADCWYLAMAGVDPVAQGQGLGSSLLRHALAICEREGLPAYLEASSPRSRRLYERLGFEVLGVIQAGGSPPVWPMLRSPRGPA